jgi:hypothetical protein
VEASEVALWLAGWVVAFMLGKELQTGFTRWRDSRHTKQGVSRSVHEAPANK